MYLNASVQRLPGYAEGRIDLMRDASRSSGPPTTRAIDITHKEATELHALLERVAVGGCGVDGADGCNAKALMAFTRHLRHLLLR